MIYTYFINLHTFFCAHFNFKNKRHLFLAEFFSLLFLKKSAIIILAQIEYGFF